MSSRVSSFATLNFGGSTGMASVPFFDWTETFRSHGQFVNPQRLFVREQSGTEVWRQKKLIELHLRKICGTQDDVSVIDHQLAVEPAAHDPVGVRLVRFQIETVELV